MLTAEQKCGCHAGTSQSMSKWNVTLVRSQAQFGIGLLGHIGQVICVACWCHACPVPHDALPAMLGCQSCNRKGWLGRCLAVRRELHTFCLGCGPRVPWAGGRVVQARTHCLQSVTRIPCPFAERSGPLVTAGKYTINLFNIWEKHWQEISAAWLQSGFRT